MRRMIGGVWYELPESSNRAPKQIDELMPPVLKLAQLLDEKQSLPPETDLARRACRGCGRLTQMRSLKIVESPAGWRQLCSTCRAS